MKLFVILAAIALSNGAKLDKTYLPPSNAPTSGGSGNFLQAPFSGPSSDYQAQNGNGFARNGNGFSQNGNGFSQNSNAYSQNGNGFSQNGNAYSQNGNADFRVNGFNNFEARPERAQAAFERNAAILRQDNQNDGENYSYAYETENGIYAEENGVATNGVEAQGGFSYTGDDGQVYTIRYTADQNGFVPQGDHLPTPPPVPEEILKALEQNARDEAAGIYDDGSYNERKYGNGEEYSTNANNFNNNYNNNVYNDQKQYESDEDTVVTNSALLRNAGNQGLNGGDNQGFNGSNNQGSFNQQVGVSNQGSFNQGRNNGVNKAYLPPFSNQEASARSGFGARSRQPSFSARNGYRY